MQSHYAQPLIAKKAEERMLAGKRIDPVPTLAQGKTRGSVSVGTLYAQPLIAEKAREKQGMRTDFVPKLGRSYNPIDTQKELAATAGVSHDATVGASL